ncbi:MAG TPA: sialidase family protein [Spirochaetia bacterium]|jgi:hypothetical protein|nr:sialidase family protein [Spirochaetia bacterium]
MATEYGAIVLELPPGEKNPRNSEGAFLDLNDGSLLFAYSRFIGENTDDTARACIASRVSHDGGWTWGEDRILVDPEDDRAVNVMSVSLLRMENGDVGLFYGIRHGWHDARIHLRRSADEGKSFSSPFPCIPSRGYYVVNNDRVVRLSSGRIIIPAAFHKMGGESVSDYSQFDHRGVVCFFYSDDDGATWSESKTAHSFPGLHSLSGLQEPGIVERSDGTLWAFCRTDMGRQYELFSCDRGESWTLPSPSLFTSPCSPLSIKRLPDGKTLLAVWNPVPFAGSHSERRKKMYRGRTPLAFALSRDEGSSWSDMRILEGDDDRGYCYTAIHFLNDAVLLAYCAGKEAVDKDQLARLRIRRIPLSDLQ